MCNIVMLVMLLSYEGWAIGGKFVKSDYNKMYSSYVSRI